MTLAARVIPVMLVKSRLLVKGERFQNNRVIGHPLQAALTHAKRQVDELLILDVSATAEHRGPDLTLVEELTDEIFVPITVGGGVRTANDVRALLAAGADKVLIGAAAREAAGWFLVEALADKFGSQAIVVSIDHRAGDIYTVGNAKRMAAFGAGEILLNNREREGTMHGFDLDLITAVSDAVTIPVIACGGCSSYANMAEAIHAGASGVGVGALFCFEDATPAQAAEHLAAAGIEARR